MNDRRRVVNELDQRGKRPSNRYNTLVRLQPAPPGVIRTINDEQQQAGAAAISEYEERFGKFISNVTTQVSFNVITRTWAVGLIIHEEENR